MAIPRYAPDPTPNRPVVKFYTPPDQVDLRSMLPRIIGSQGWDVGTEFTVQFLSHDRTKLLRQAQFVVSMFEERSVLDESDPQHPTAKQVKVCRFAAIGSWFAPPERMPTPVKEAVEDTFVEAPKLSLSWSETGHTFLVKDNNGVTVYKTKDKSEGQRMVSGEVPVPEQVKRVHKQVLVPGKERAEQAQV